jgi:DME family drug/metabolite transporter
MDRTAARFSLFLAALLFSTVGAVVKELTLTPWQIVFLRSLVAAATLTLFVRPPAPRSRLVIVAGVAYAATTVLFIVATRLTTAANAIFLQSAAPLYLLAFLVVRGRRLRVAEGAASLMIISGIAMTLAAHASAGNAGPHSFVGVVLSVASGVTLAATIGCLRMLAVREGNETDLAASATVIGNVFAALIALPFALPITLDGKSIGLVLYLGIFQIGLSYWLIGRAVRHVNALEASTILLLETVLNPLWAWLVVREAPGVATTVGGAAILGGALWLARQSNAERPGHTTRSG